jgi:polyisoprenoid-binding protein YceI
MKIPALIVAALAIGTNSAVLATESYRFDQNGSIIGFAVHQFLGTANGKFAQFEGKIDLDREHPENSSVVVRIDVRSIDTGIQKRDNHLRSSEFFNVDKFPEINFKSHSVKQTGPQSADITGEFTMHGVTKPITLHAKLITPMNETKRTRWAITTPPINRRDFNLMFSSGAETLSGISQSVSINIEIDARRL